MEADKVINTKNFKINDLMTELENTKTDLTYTNKKLQDANQKYDKINEELINVHSSYQKIIENRDNERRTMKEQLAASMA